MNETITATKATKKLVTIKTTIEDVKLARAYVPVQVRCAVFTPAVSLTKGTAFPPLWNDCFLRTGGVIDD